MKSLIKLVLAGFIVAITLYNFGNRIERYYNRSGRYVVVTDSITKADPSLKRKNISLIEEFPICVADDTLYSLYEKIDSAEFLLDAKGALKQRTASSKRFVDYVVSGSPTKYLQLIDSVQELTIIHRFAHQIKGETHFFILGRKDKQKGLPIYLLSKNIDTDSCYTYENADLEYVSARDELSAIDGYEREFSGIVVNDRYNSVVFRFERMASSGNTFPVYIRFDGSRFNEVDLSTIVYAGNKNEPRAKETSNTLSINY
ncbi:MAG: hypothetical protein ACRC13_11760 [Tannerellaceae bacterium]